MLPVVEGDEHHILLEQVAGPEEEAGAAAHDEGAAVEVDHHRALLLVQLGRVHVEGEAVLVAHGLVGRDVELGTEVPVLRGVPHLLPALHGHGGLPETLSC